MEFRCFVSNKSLIGISQRDWRQYFDFVEAEKNSLAVEMQTFIEKKVLSRFPSDSCKYALNILITKQVIEPQKRTLKKVLTAIFLAHSRFLVTLPLKSISWSCLLPFETSMLPHPIAIIFQS